MVNFDTYKELLSEEQACMERLCELAKSKRRAILEGSSDELVSISSEEDSILDRIQQLRQRRQEEASGLEGGRWVGESAGIARQRLLKEAPAHIREDMTMRFERYGTLLRSLRRESRINNTLLSDRLRLIHLAVDRVLSTVTPKDAYDGRPASAKRRPADAMILDQKV